MMPNSASPWENMGGELWTDRLSTWLNTTEAHQQAARRLHLQNGKHSHSPGGGDDAYREATGDPMQLISKNMAQLWRSLFGYRAVVPLIPQFMGKNEGVDSGGKIGLVRLDFCEYQIHFHCGNCLGEDAYGCVWYFTAGCKCILEMQRSTGNQISAWH